MPLSVRDLGLEAVPHLGVDYNLDTTMPTGARLYLLNVINRALEQMRVEAPELFKETIGLTWGPATTGTVNATLGSSTVTLGTLAAPADGTSISLAGDASINEIRASVTEDGTYLLLHPFSGTSGVVAATAYGDSVILETTVDTVLGASLLHERRRLDILSSREEWMQHQRSWGSVGFDYGMTSGAVDQVRQPGIPRAVWIETFNDPQGSDIRYRARCAPMPNSTYRATLEVLSAVREAEDEDLDDGADAYLPVPGGRSHTILRALVMYHWSNSPWFKNGEARPGIAEGYKQALAQLEQFKASASAGFQLRIRP